MWPKVYVPRPAGIGWPVFHLYTRSTPVGEAPKVCDAVEGRGGDDVDVVGEDDVAR